MKATIKGYFACANSSRGFCNYFDSNLQGLERLYILKGGPGTGKSTLMKEIGADFYDLGYDIEFIYCSSDPSSLDGVLIPALKVGIVDGEVTDQDTLAKLATIPSREGLLTMLAAGMMGIPKDLSICLDLYAKQKEEN